MQNNLTSLFEIFKSFQKSFYGFSFVSIDGIGHLVLAPMFDPKELLCKTQISPELDLKKSNVFDPSMEKELNCECCQKHYQELKMRLDSFKDKEWLKD